jgi:hypothetical protein
MKTIRFNTFETNSSSCHVVTVLSDYELEQLKNNELLLVIYKSQNEKALTKQLDKWRFKYEIEHYQFCYDYDKGEQKYVDIERDTLQAFTNDLWDLLVKQTHEVIEGYSDKLQAIYNKYNLDKDFIESVDEFIGHFAGKYTIQDILENIQQFKMPNGDVMNFSCINREC